MRSKKFRSTLITFGIVIAAFIACQVMISTGAMTRSLKGQLVPICAYVVMAVSLNLTVGISGELSLGHAGFMSVGAFSGIVMAMWLSKGMGVANETLCLLLAILTGGAAAGIAGVVIGISCQGAARGLIAAVRIVVLIAGSLVMTTTTTPSEVADALSSLMAPFGILGLPVGDLAMLASVVLRFIPLAAEELVRIRDAQRARAVDFAEGNPVVRVQRWLSVLMPLVVALFRRAEDLADAMRERGYRGRGRTRLTRSLRPTDIVVLVIVLAATLAACIA